MVALVWERVVNLDVISSSSIPGLLGSPSSDREGDGRRSIDEEVCSSE